MNSFKKKALRFGAMAVAAVAVFAVMPITADASNGNCNKRPDGYFGDGIEALSLIKMDRNDRTKTRFCAFSSCGNRVEIGQPYVERQGGNRSASDITVTLEGLTDDRGGYGHPEDVTRCGELTLRTNNSSPGNYKVFIPIRDMETGRTNKLVLKLKVLECVRAPEYSVSTYEVHVEPGERVQVDICARPSCYDGDRDRGRPNHIRLEMIGRPPFIDPIGHIESQGRRRHQGDRGRDKHGMEERDNGELCLWIDQIAREATYGTYWAKFRVTDLKNWQSHEFKIKMVLKEPSCDKPKGWFDVSGPAVIAAGMSDSVPFTVESGCGTDAAMLVVAASADAPPFCTIAPVMDGEPGQYELICNTTEADAGKYEVCLEVSDPNVPGETSTFCINLNVLGMSDMDCTEKEGETTSIGATGCLAADNALFYGDLGTPDDVDLFTIEELEPFTQYEVMVAGGIDIDGAILDTAMGCYTGGVLNHADDNSGPMPGYSLIRVTTDENGSCTVAVSGGGDLNFDGIHDANGGAHGRMGAYVIMIPNANPNKILGDLDGDGDRDADDLLLLADMLGDDFKIKITER